MPGMNSASIKKTTLQKSFSYMKYIYIHQLTPANSQHPFMVGSNEKVMLYT